MEKEPASLAKLEEIEAELREEIRKDPDFWKAFIKASAQARGVWKEKPKTKRRGRKLKDIEPPDEQSNGETISWFGEDPVTEDNLPVIAMQEGMFGGSSVPPWMERE